MTKFTNWRKATASANQGGGCVEVAFAGSGTVGVRDTQQFGRGPVLEFDAGAWTRFLDSAVGRGH